MSDVPRHSEGTGSTGECMPKSFIISATAAGEYCFITQAVMLLFELAKPHFNDTISPARALPAFFGVQVLPSGNTNVCGTFGTKSHGVCPSCIARAYTNGLIVEPT